MSEDNVENWCVELGIQMDSWKGSGEFGDAYSVSGDKVIKITSDYNEFIQTFNILKNKSEYLPEIYEMRIFKDGSLGILMEELILEGVEDLFNELRLEASIQNCDILDIDLDSALLSDETIKFAKDLARCDQELNINGIFGRDIHENNIGLNSRGNYVLFDQTIKHSKDYNEDLLMDIEEKLKDQYNIETSIFIKDCDIARIVVSRGGMAKALKDISIGRISMTNEPIQCMYNINGDLQLIDGYHRLCESMLTGLECVDIEIGYDERYGISNPVYARVEREDSLEIDKSLFHNGLEDLACELTLSDYLDSYIEIKKRKPAKIKHKF